MKVIQRVTATGIVLLAISSPAVQAGTINAINHTKWAINSFSVNEQSGIDVIGPFQGGGGGCCFGTPGKWQPGMTVKVDWITGVAFASDVPEIPAPERPNTTGMNEEQHHQAWVNYYEKNLIWRQKIKALSKKHSLIVPLPDYSGQKTCGITVHFLPCDQIKVTTSCFNYGHPNYPIKEPINMEEPKVCPK